MLKYKKNYLKYFSIGVFVLAFIVSLFFLNKFAKLSSVKVSFFDEQTENKEIETYLQNYFNKNAGSLINFLLLDQKKTTEALHNEFVVVDHIVFSKNMDMTLTAVVYKNEKFFNTCLDGEQFLVKCSEGNKNGVFYKELAKLATSTLEIKIIPEVLYDTETEKQIIEPDTLSLNRIYAQSDFTNLRETILFFAKSYHVKKVEVEKLKIAKIYLDDFYVVINMGIDYVATKKTFDILSRRGELHQYLIGKPKSILYVDLSFKNKVFYKLVSAAKTENYIDEATSTMKSSAH